MSVTTIPTAGIADDAVTTAKAAFSAGKVLQVIQDIDHTDTAISTDADTDIGLSVTITPSSTSSKILVMLDLQYTFVYSSGASNGFQTKILRGGSAVFSTNTDYDVYYQSAGGNANYRARASYSYLDSPNSTSALTYTVSLNRHTTTTVDIGEGQNILTVMEIGT
jgi:hypothetical protein